MPEATRSNVIERPAREVLAFIVEGENGKIWRSGAQRSMDLEMQALDDLKRVLET